MFCIHRATARILARQPSKFFVYQPRSITTLTTRSIRNLYPGSSITVQKRNASNNPSESHPALANDTAAPSQPEITSAAQFDVADIQPTDARTVPEPEQEAISLPSASNPADAEATIRGTTSQSSSDATKEPARDSNDTVHDLYCGNLFFDVREEDLRQEFSKYGELLKVRVVYDPRGLSKGFGYVGYRTAEEAAAAQKAMDRQVFQGRRLTVQPATSVPRQSPREVTPRNPPSQTLFIGNMSFDISDQDLNDLFRDVANVLDVRVAIDRRTGQPRGFAHADFVDVASAQMAVNQLQGKIVYGRPLRIDFTVPSDAHQRRTSGGGANDQRYASESGITT